MSVRASPVERLVSSNRATDNPEPPPNCVTVIGRTWPSSLSVKLPAVKPATGVPVPSTTDTVNVTEGQLLETTWLMLVVRPLSAVRVKGSVVSTLWFAEIWTFQFPGSEAGAWPATSILVSKQKLPAAVNVHCTPAEL